MSSSVGPSRVSRPRRSSASTSNGSTASSTGTADGARIGVLSVLKSGDCDVMALYLGSERAKRKGPFIPPPCGRGIAYGIFRFFSRPKRPNWIRKFPSEGPCDSKVAQTGLWKVICDSPARKGRGEGEVADSACVSLNSSRFSGTERRARYSAAAHQKE